MAMLFVIAVVAGMAIVATGLALVVAFAAVFLIGGGILLWLTSAPAPLPLEGEVVRTLPANHFMGIEGRGGRLTITDRELSFAPHPFNLQRSPVRVMLDEITSVSPHDPYGVFRTGLSVGTAGGTQTFVVADRDALIAWLGERCGLAPVDDSAGYAAGVELHPQEP